MKRPLRLSIPLAALALAAAACDTRPPSRPDTGARAPVAATATAPVAAPVTAPVVATAPVTATATVTATAGRRVALETKAMGTHLQLVTFTTESLDEHALRPKLEKAVAEIRRLESLMTTWREDSEISQVNANAGKAAIEVSPESLAVIEKSVWISKLSGGVFDITFEAMHGLWKFDEDLSDNVPDRAAVERARRLIDYRQIKIDPAKRTILLAKPGMRMSLGGIAKGFAVDAAARVLRGEGLTSFFVQAGGDLYVAGTKPDGSRWRVGVRDPRGTHPTDFFALVEVEDHAFSTAGDYERSFVKDGKRYHHIIDPRTGFPATASRSVTVWAKDALTADAIDDAVFILGPKKGLELAEAMEDCGVVIVDKDNKVWISKRLEGKVQKLREPTDGI